MKKSEALQEMKTSFENLPDRELSNLLFHAKRNARILCGKDAMKVFDEHGHG